MLRTGWEHQELEEELNNSDINESVHIYKREKVKYYQLCRAYSRSMKPKVASTARLLEIQCNIQKDAMDIVARHIANTLAKKEVS